MMTPVDFIRHFYNSIIEKRVNDIIHSYLDSEEVYVILEGPRLSTKGIKKIASGWADFCDSSIELHSIQWEDGPYIHEAKDSASVIGIILMKGLIAGKIFETTFRASFFLIHKDNRYFIVHEHVSGALTDPYGIGDWKK
jgi:ketosteroid isomerase-like protein